MQGHFAAQNLNVVFGQVELNNQQKMENCSFDQRTQSEIQVAHGWENLFAVTVKQVELQNLLVKQHDLLAVQLANCQMENLSVPQVGHLGSHGHSRDAQKVKEQKAGEYQPIYQYRGWMWTAPAERNWVLHMLYSGPQHSEGLTEKPQHFDLSWEGKMEEQCSAAEFALSLRLVQL